MDQESKPQADGAATCARLREIVGGSAIGAEGVSELESMVDLLAAAGGVSLLLR